MGDRMQFPNRLPDYPITRLPDHRSAAVVGRHARLELAFECRDGRTVLTHAYAEPPLRIGRTFDVDGAAYVILVCAGPGVFAGDCLHHHVTVGRGCARAARLPVGAAGSSSRRAGARHRSAMTIGSPKTASFIASGIRSSRLSGRRLVQRVRAAPRTEQPPVLERRAHVGPRQPRRGVGIRIDRP